MPAPINPKKRALMPSSPLRKTLRGAGHHLSVIVQIGKEGVTDPVIRQLDEALYAHELVKLKINTEAPEDRFEVADALAERSGAQVVQILGRTILVYRRHPERPRFEPWGPGEEPPVKVKEEEVPRRRRAARGRSRAKAFAGPARARTQAGAKSRGGEGGWKPRAAGAGARSRGGAAEGKPRGRTGGKPRGAAGGKPRGAAGGKPRGAAGGKPRGGAGRRGATGKPRAGAPKSRR
jgi:RNA-binding protein